MMLDISVLVPFGILAIAVIGVWRNGQARVEFNAQKTEVRAMLIAEAHMKLVERVRVLEEYNTLRMQNRLK